MFRTALTLLLPLIPTAAQAGYDYLGVKAQGGMPSECALELTYKNGDTGFSTSCIVGGDDATSDRTYSCAVDDGKISQIDHASSSMTVEVVPASLWDCFEDGGVTISQLHGDGNSNNFTTKKFDTARDGLVGWTTDCGVDYFADKDSYGNHGRFHLAGAAGNDDNDKVLTSVKVSPARTNSTGVLKDCGREEVNFCEMYDGQSVAVLTSAGKFLRARGSNHGYDVDQNANLGQGARWDVECTADGQVQLGSKYGRYLRGTDTSAVLQWTTAGWWQRWDVHYNNSDNTWSLDSHHGEWLRATSGGDMSTTSGSKGNSEKFGVAPF